MLKNWFGKDKKSLADALDKEQNSAATVVIDEERTEENWIRRLRGGLDKTRGAWVTSISNLFSGKISEVITFNRELTSSERLEIDSYLKEKWGLRKFG